MIMTAASTPFPALAGAHHRKRLFTIINPDAGRGRRDLLDQSVRMLRARKAHVTTVLSAHRADSTRLAAEAAQSGRYDAVIAAGGDGTVHDVAKGLIGNTVPLGIIPLGTANVLAREIGMQPEPALVAATLLSGPARRIRLGMADAEPFLFVVGIGLDAAAVRHFEAGKFRRLGPLGLVPPVIRALAENQEQPLAIELNGERKTAHWALITRVPHYAANILLCEDASLFSEDVCVVLFHGRGWAVRLRQLTAMVTGLLRHDPGVSILRAKHVRISGPADTPVQMDGESTGHLPLSLSVSDKHLRLIFPSTQ